MRLINRLFATLLVVATTLMVGCERPAPLPTEENMAVTYSTLDGYWRLSHIQGAPIAEDTYLYIEFDRTEHRYTMWDNLNSMYGTTTTGTFAISEEEDGTYTLSGTYDYGVGDWNNEYRVELSNKGATMQWWTKGSHEVMEFEQVSEIPEIY